jgi:hypothetical protein
MAGLFHRRTTAGEEKELVDGFVKNNLTPAPEGQLRFVFVEPRLETGFPDLVVVYLDDAAAKEWNLDRAGFSKREICLLHHLATTGSQSPEDLTSIFSTGLKPAIAKLEAAGLIRCVQKQWRALATRKLLAVRRIVAIEAKVGGWRGGLDQAFMNRWFASESYLLLPSRPQSPELAIELAATGVGLLTASTSLRRPLIPAEKSKLPGSYATWLFNEWACQARPVTASPKSVAASRRDHPPMRRRR